ncbi:PHP domain-containing protein [Salidesulfovibrio onnuriiensis]|uniref:PHP domain-containing protein n=1 Tax=Salidesulfovibrio onnuriiensis TaxID=2583823 RepID=UPI001C9BDFFE
MIDLHTHSTASDGTDSPRELVRKAAEIGLEALALTDHDTLQGLPEALEAGREFGVEVVPGCELSVESPEGVGWIHIVGLWIPEEAEPLQRAFDWVIEGRETRNHEIIARLRKLGINITYDNVVARAGGTVGRPHIAQELLSLGVVESVQHAFGQYLGDNGRAYVPKRKLSREQAIGVLREVGATSILAHPFMLGPSPALVESIVGGLKDMGLDGMEVFYTEHDESATKLFGRLADKFGLLKSGGSDYHGHVKPGTKLGVGKDNLDISYDLLEAMKEARRARGQWVTERIGG